VRAARGHEEDKFTDLVREVAPDLLAYFERRITDRTEAADLLGETLLVLWRRASVAPSDHEGARMWMFGIARNVLNNYHRGVRRQLRLADALRDELMRTSQPAHEEDTDAVVEAVNSLPPDLRELVRLVHWDGFKLVEAAQLLGINASSARSRYSRARSLLAQDLIPRLAR